MYEDLSMFHWSVALTDYHRRLVAVATLAS
jgi:hypothetical protein